MQVTSLPHILPPAVQTTQGFEDCWELKTTITGISQIALSNANDVVPKDNNEWKARVERTKKNNALLTRFNNAVMKNKSLSFLDEEQLDVTMLPTPSYGTYKMAIRNCNSKAVGFYFNCKIYFQNEYLARWIYNIMKKDLNKTKETHEKWSNFIVEIILQNQPQVRPDFLHRFVIIHKHNKIIHGDRMEHTRKENIFRLFLRQVLLSVNRCFNIDNQSFINQFRADTLEYVLESKDVGSIILIDNALSKLINERIAYLKTQKSE